ncbi:MAG: NAD(P)H-hydrate dehydratase [Caulobacter sp.]|nr:NAD(P)H-hydrate dehydratase [Caulobacter sp.]
MAAEILTVEEMGAADRAAIAAGTPGSVLMERAGQAVADAIRARFKPCRVAVLCGPGNNGGDGYVVARLLKRRGWSVWVETLAPPVTADARAAAARWRGETLPISASGRTPDLYVDALFGAGLSRPLEGEALRLARQLKAFKGRIVAIDVPSGLHGDTGRPLGDAAFRADLTVTFHRRKIAHALEPGRSECGEVVVVGIGLGKTSSTLFENGPDLWLSRFPWPSAASHKHARGRLMVVGGDASHTGAARLAARGGLRIGAGLVTLFSPPAAAAINAAHLEAVMLEVFESDQALAEAADRADAAIIGPAAGVNPGTRANLLALARTGAALVIDADALTVFRDKPAELFQVLDRDDVLTPHPGEFERLFPGLLKTAVNRVAAAREAAGKAGTIVLLKGPDTVIAAPDGRAAVNLESAPWLATAGSGDVLAGFIGGLLAQGMDSFEAACAGAWIHAACARRFGPGLIAEDLPGLAPAVLTELYAARGSSAPA